MKKHVHVFALLVFVSCSLCKGQNKTELLLEPQEQITVDSPGAIVRNLKQDKKGNMWVAAFDGIYRYDGKSFARMTGDLSPTRFFSVAEDRKGNFWFGTIGSGAYYYDGKSFKNFTSAQGLASDDVLFVYEDKGSQAWFATSNGVSRYDGKAFKNYRLSDGLTNKEDNSVNAIVEDKTGKFWFGTRGRAYVFDGKTSTLLTHEGKPFWNITSLIEDKKGNIWLSGEQGLWRYDGHTFIQINHNLVGQIYEDRNGNIWTSSQRGNGQGPAQGWAISRYDEKTLSGLNPAITEIQADHNHNGMLFGLTEANDGSIWYGALDGVHRYDGNAITFFKSKEK